jgi:hypothetical protein
MILASSDSTIGSWHLPLLVLDVGILCYLVSEVVGGQNAIAFSTTSECDRFQTGRAIVTALAPSNGWVVN